MRKKKLCSLVIALIAALLAGPVPVSADRAGSAAGQFLMLGPGARPAAMGGAYTAVADGVNALYWNPAGLGRLEGSELTFMYSSWFQDVAYNYAAFAYGEPILDGHLGANLTLLDYGEIAVTRINGQTPVTGLGKTDAGDYEFGVGYGRAWDLFDWGLNVKYVSAEVAGYSDFAVGCDLGVLFNVTPDPNLRFGAALLNLGSKLGLQSRGDPLPLTFKLGGVYRLPEPELMATADLIIPADERISGAVGLEYAPMRMLALRAGYNSENDAGDGWSVGAGFNPNPDFSVDYAFVPYGDLGNAHRVSLDYRFGAWERRPEPRNEAGRYPRQASRPAPPERSAPTRESRTPAAPEPLPATPIAIPESDGRSVADLIESGLEQYRDRRYDLAAREFIAAFGLEPRNPIVAFNLATTYYGAGAYDHAEEWFEYYTALAPADANGFAWLGNCRDRTGRTDQAVAAWQRALELDPENRTARAGLSAGRK